MLSTVTVTGTWVTPTVGTPTGSVTFQPVVEATGGGYIVAGTSVTAPLVAGSLSETLVNNTQVTTLQYLVTEQIANAPSVAYVITPTGSTLDLSSVARTYIVPPPSPAAGYVLASSIGTVNGTTDWYNVKDPRYGATGNGTTDDTTAIQSAITAANAAGGGTVYFPAGIYRTSQAIIVLTNVTLRGCHAVGWVNRFPQNICAIRPLSTFTVVGNGDCALALWGNDITGNPNYEGNVRITDLELDGSALPSGSVSGIHAQGQLMDLVLRNVTIRNFTHNGLWSNVGAGTLAPHDWYMDTVVCYQNATYGFSMSMTDGYIRNCIATTNGSDGWYMGPFGSMTFEGPQALFNSGNGFNFVTGTNMGNLTMVGALTDRNNFNGINIPSSSAAGSPPIIITGATLNRDGSNSDLGGAGYAGLAITGCANPIIINGLTVNTGVDDGGSGVNSPEYGVSFTSTNAYIQVANSYVHGNIAGWHDDGTQVVLRRFNVDEATGPKATPTLVYGAGIVTDGTTNSLSVPGHALGLPRPREQGLLAWAYDPAHCSAGVAGTAATVYLTAIYVDHPVSVSKIYWGNNTAGVTPTSGANWVGLYNAAGALVQSTNVDASVTTTGLVTTTITATPVTPGLYWVGFVFTAATMPQLYRAGFLNGNLVNAGQTATPALMRFATNATGQTSLPATITLSANVASQTTWWAAIG